MKKELNGYNLSRTWFDFCFENPDIISPSHTALYFFIIEHCNRLGWKQKFGLPTTMAMEALGIKSYNTYKKVLTNIIDWGFLIMIESSKNQYSSNIVALSNFDKALYKALDKALIKHGTKQSESTVQSIDSIDKQVTNEQGTREPDFIPKEEIIIYPIEHCVVIALNDERWVRKNKVSEKDLHEFNDMLEGRGQYKKNPQDYKTHFFNWKRSGKKDEPATIQSNAPMDYMDPKTRAILYPEK